MSDEKKKAPDATYVVQRWEDVQVVVPKPLPKGSDLQSSTTLTTTEKRGYWHDFATIEVPGGTNRKTVLKKALAESNLQPNKDGSPPRLRVLDADSAFVHEPEAVQPPMEWKL